MTLPVLGAHTFGFAWDCVAEDAIERLAAAGYRTIQLMATPPHFDPWVQDAARTRRIPLIVSSVTTDGSPRTMPCPFR